MEFTLLGDNTLGDFKLKIEEDSGDALVISLVLAAYPDDSSAFVRVSRKDFLRLAQAIKWSQPDDNSYEHPF